MLPACEGAEYGSGQEPPRQKSKLPNRIGDVEQAPEPRENRPCVRCRQDHPYTGCRCSDPEGQSAFPLIAHLLGTAVNSQTRPTDHIRTGTHSKRPIRVDSESQRIRLVRAFAAFGPMSIPPPALSERNRLDSRR